MEVRGEMSRERIYQGYPEDRKIEKATLEICKIRVSILAQISCSHVKLVWEYLEKASNTKSHLCL